MDGVLFDEFVVKVREESYEALHLVSESHWGLLDEL